MTTGRARWRLRGDHGAATVESTGMIAVAALLAVAVLLAAAPGAPGLGSAFLRAICVVTTLGQGTCGGTTLPEDHVPVQPCVLNAQSTSMNREIAVVVVTAADGRKFEVAQLSDGRYRITQLSSGSVGLETGVGGGITVTVQDRTVGGSAKAEASASLDIHNGRVWYTTDPAEVSRMLNEEAEDTIEDEVIGDDGPLRWLWERGQDVVTDDYDFPEPDETYAEGGVSLNASAEVTAITDRANAEVGTTQALGVRSTRDGRTTVYLKTAVEGEAGLQALGIDTSGARFEGAQLQGRLELITAVTYDSSGEMVEVSTTGVAAGESKGVVSALFGGSTDASLDNEQSQAVVFQATLPVRDVIDRSIATNFLVATGINQLGGVALSAPAAPYTLMSTTQFLHAARDRGFTTQQRFNTDNTTNFAIDAEGKLGVELGANVSVESSSMESLGGEYWDGTGWRRWQGCGS
jgi:hypothetical protein